MQIQIGVGRLCCQHAPPLRLAGSQHGRYRRRNPQSVSVQVTAGSGWRRITDYLRRVPTDGLGLSLFYPASGLPPHGQTPIHVWEDSCKACEGTGMARLRSRGRGRSAARAMLGVCIACHGVGVLRRASARLIPTDLPNEADSTYLAIARQQAHEGSQTHSPSTGQPSDKAGKKKVGGLPSLGELKAKAAQKAKAAGKTEGQTANTPASQTAAKNGHRQVQQTVAGTNGRHKDTVVQQNTTSESPPAQLQRLPSFGRVAGHEAPSSTAMKLPPREEGSPREQRDPALR